MVRITATNVKSALERAPGVLKILFFSAVGSQYDHSIGVLKLNHIYDTILEGAVPEVMDIHPGYVQEAWRPILDEANLEPLVLYSWLAQIDHKVPCPYYFKSFGPQHYCTADIRKAVEEVTGSKVNLNLVEKDQLSGYFAQRISEQNSSLSHHYASSCTAITMKWFNLITSGAAFFAPALATSPPRSDIRCEKYDYIVVGGGTSGLVVANRLTENSRATVLVVERGGFANGPRAIVPYWANDLDTSLMIGPTSAPVTNLNNATFQVAVASVVGGATVINGMAYMRGSRAEYDAWEELGNPGWGWNGLLPYFRKSSTFDPPSAEATEEWGMKWDPSVFGNGPVRSTIPDFQYPDLHTFLSSWRDDDTVPKPDDVNAGLGPGAYWAPSTIDAGDRTRTTARKAYYDPVFSQRPNLRLLTEHTVTEIVFQNLRAVGVKITSQATNEDRIVCASKEVILAAGAIQTPHLLQKYAPGVGANFQDHAAVLMIFDLANASFPNPNTITTNATYNATVWNEYWTNRTGPIAAGSSSRVTLLSLSHSTSAAASIVNRITAQDPRDYLPSSHASGPLLKGFKKQRGILARLFGSQDASASSHPFPGGGLAPAVLLKPLSRGSVTVDPADPHGLPVVQYNTFMNPVDADIAVAMVKRARAFWSKPDISVLQPTEILPGPQHSTDEEILAALKSGGLLPTLAHPSGSCSMMPEDLGGCVGSDLRVYGVKALSVVDASIIPLIPGAPLQATVYAVAEKAADIIKSRA
ncbi:hypothetical protein jhhlp_004916 [Lomentospora prolificans]|uniref:Glucose-methanol-choline oxidoreductase N-terminal domain-containing protein n=1 Tax=Lomentospora prolificans TaxID=41688 RepID=A0A2N3N7U8_9PEZI|nr:hypothetical protein jhhlp_004916 [Lomentospora prolificans]